MVYRRTWLVIVSGFFEPLFYLLGIGFGLGALVGAVTGPDGQPIPYGVFVAPGLLATSAMNGAVYESTFNVFFKLRYAKTYDAILSTPMGIDDVAVGEVGWSLIRGALYADRVPRGGRPARARRLAARPALPARRAPRRVRLRRGRDGGHDLDPDLAGLRRDHRGDPAAVPLLGHVLPDHRLPGAAPDDRRGHPALPGRRDAPPAGDRGDRPGRSSSTSPTSRSMGLAGLAVVARRLDRLLLK